MTVWHILIVVTCYLAWRGFVWDPIALKKEQVEIEIKDLPPGLRGMRIVHATDLHLRNERIYEQRFVEMVRQAEPDLIVLTGDYTDNVRNLQVLAQVIRNLREICPVYAVLGDNDLNGHVPTADLTNAIEDAGGVVLRNSGVEINRRNSQLYLAGIDDPRLPTASLQSALAGRSTPMPTLLLSHSALIYPQAQEADVDLLLAGHTHGGQCCIPGFGALITNDKLGRRFASGLIREGRLQIYVSRGVGWAKLRVRFYCPPEVTVLALDRE
ncbi:MAG TPA: metallophosphoesterase [Firmicutes bacterium]|jgi:predicted MPP superfamily phosphohydrolase|nr:metallophosphoesterase [Bacillota bacterium]